MVRIRFEIFLDSRLFIAINVHQQSIDINHVSILKMLIHIKLIDRKYTIPNLTTYININENIDKQYDNKDRISGDIICPLLSYNNDMSIPRKQRAVSPIRLSGRHSPVDPQKRQYMYYVNKTCNIKIK